MASDPICGMYVPETPDQLRSRKGSVDYYFCSSACLRTFEAPAAEQRRLAVYTAASLAAGALILLLMFTPAGDEALVRLGRPGDHAFLNGILLAIATPIQFVAGARFYAGLAHAVRARAANMDTLIAIGTSTAYAYSAIVTAWPARFGHDTYFDTSVLIIAFILLGRTLEHRMKDRATEALRSLARLAPSTARRRTGETEAEIAIETVRVGDHLVVRPGERIPTDGRILEGEADVDESLVTGESVPVHRTRGQGVVGGSLDANGLIVIEATRVGSDTLLAQIGQLVERAQAGKAPIQRLVDRVSAWFVPIVLLVAVLAGAYWALAETLSRGALVSVAVLIIACPCALGLATPAALLVGVARGAHGGILVKETEPFERAAKADLVLFDKTGTLTRGRPTVTDVVPMPGPTAEEVLRVAASVESGSQHPLARAVVAHAHEKRIRVATPQEFAEKPGQGVVGIVEGQAVLVGSAAWMELLRMDAKPMAADLERLEGAGKTVLYVARGSSLLGLIALRDELKPGVPELIEALRRMRIEAALVSGDNHATAKAIAAEAGIRAVHAPVLPSRKAEIIDDQRRLGHVVAMVGDGINDAPALSAADAGLALGGGTDIAREAGGLVLMRDDPRDVANAIHLARRTTSKIRQNLFWAFVYNVALIPVAALGLLDPIFAGAAMALSSLTVVGNSLLLLRHRPLLASTGGLRQRDATAEGKRPGKRIAMAAMVSAPGGSAVDPVCKMRVDPATTPHRHVHAGATYYFCSAGCMRQFAAEPTKFLA